jgi:hypothetical protein
MPTVPPARLAEISHVSKILKLAEEIRNQHHGHALIQRDFSLLQRVKGIDWTTVFGVAAVIAAALPLIMGLLLAKGR